MVSRFFTLINFWLYIDQIKKDEETLQGRSQNLKEVPQNFTEDFNIDDVVANDVIQRNQHRKEKKTWVP